jgi:hypothetical protein
VTLASIGVVNSAKDVELPGSIFVPAAAAQPGLERRRAGTSSVRVLTVCYGASKYSG